MKKLLYLIVSLSVFSISEIMTQSLHIPLSPLQVLSQQVGQTQIKLTYSRPSMRGRVIFGGLEQYDEKWRTGANRNSKIQFSDPVEIDGEKISAGTYAIITTPGRESWELYLYSDTTNWEVPKPWVDSLVALQITLPAENLDETVQSMKFSIDDLTYNSCTLSLSWENTRIKFPIKMSTEEKLQKAIDKILSGPTARDYNTAAASKVQIGKDLDDAMVWIEKAIEMRQPTFFYDVLIKAEIYHAQGKHKEALATAKESLGLAEKTGNKYRINLVKSFLEKIE